MKLFCWLALAYFAVMLEGAAANAADRVNVDNFARAESDMYFAKFVKAGALGKFHFERELAPIDKQDVIRMNRDTLYGMAVLDLTSPAKVTLPDPGKRFLSMQVINEDHYTQEVIYKPGTHSFSRDSVGTRYVALLVRILANPQDPADLKIVHSLQDAIKVEQSSLGKFEIPDWEPASHKAIREALLNLTTANGGLDSSRMFGRKDQVDPVQHLLGTAAGWGGNPVRDALYVGVVPPHNDGTTVYRLTAKDVPVDGFWSISVYNKEGFFQKNASDAYTFNNITAKPNADGSVTIQFGGREGSAPNLLPIEPGWNYLVRMYRPRKEILDGSWKFPEAVVK